MNNRKLCKGPCGEHKDLSEFNKDIKKHDGLNYYCRPCNKTYQTAYRVKQRAEVLAKRETAVSPARIWDMQMRIERSPEAALRLYNKFVKDNPKRAKKEGWKLRTAV